MSLERSGGVMQISKSGTVLRVVKEAEKSPKPEEKTSPQLM